VWSIGVVSRFRSVQMLRISRSGAVAGGVRSRRDLLQAGSLSVVSGLTLPRLLRASENQVGGVDQRSAAAARRRPGVAKSVILFNLLGGPSQLDMFDMKPGAPLEIRGQFSPIQTAISGVQICEHLPNTARIMHKLALIRSVTHNYNAHNPLNIMTGFSLGNPAALTPAPRILRISVLCVSIWDWVVWICRARCVCRVILAGVKAACIRGFVVRDPMVAGWGLSMIHCSVCVSRLLIASLIVRTMAQRLRWANRVCLRRMRCRR